MASHQNATCHGDARLLTIGSRLQCVAAAGGSGVDCAVAEFTDALLGCGNSDGAVIVAATAACGDDACWVEARVMGQAGEAISPSSPDSDETEPLVVNG